MSKLPTIELCRLGEVASDLPIPQLALNSTAKETKAQVVARQLDEIHDDEAKKAYWRSVVATLNSELLDQGLNREQIEPKLWKFHAEVQIAMLNIMPPLEQRVGLMEERIVKLEERLGEIEQAPVADEAEITKRAAGMLYAKAKKLEGQRLRPRRFE